MIFYFMPAMDHTCTDMEYMNMSSFFNVGTHRMHDKMTFLWASYDPHTHTQEQIRVYSLCIHVR